MDKETKELMGIMIGFIVLFLCALIFIGWTIYDIRKLQRELDERSEALKHKYDRLIDTTDNLKSDLDNCLDWTEINSAKISELSNIIHNTNSALGRTNKKVNSANKEETTTEAPVRQSEPIPNLSKEDVEMTEIVAEDKAVEQPTDNSNGTYLGYYTLTAYEWTGNTCANGNYPTVGYTVACNSIPLGTTIYIEGYGTYVVEDTGGMGGGTIDIYMGDVESCYAFGVQGANVYIVN